jgi:hypothetical protein
LNAYDVKGIMRRDELVESGSGGASDVVKYASFPNKKTMNGKESTRK